MESMFSNKKTIFLFVAPASLLFVLIVLLPIVASLYYSLFSWDLISPPRYIGVANFARMFRLDDVVPTALKNVLFYVVTSLVIQLVFGYLLAVLLTSRIRGRTAFKNLFFIPAVIPSVAVGLVWSFIYDPQMGTINELLRIAGLSSLARPWLLVHATALPAVTAVISWQYTGYAMIIFIAGIQNIPAELFEAARIDGAGRLQLLRLVTIPLTAPVIRVEVVLNIIGSLKLFDLVYVMTAGGPAHSTEVLASYTYWVSFRQFSYGYGDALSVLLLALCLTATILVRTLFRIENVEY